MRSLLLVLAALLSFSPAIAAESRVSPCGVYEIKGELLAPRDSSGQVVFVVNRGTRAETRFDLGETHPIVAGSRGRCLPLPVAMGWLTAQRDTPTMRQEMACGVLGARR